MDTFAFFSGDLLVASQTVTGKISWSILTRGYGEITCMRITCTFVYFCWRKDETHVDPRSTMINYNQPQRFFPAPPTPPNNYFSSDRQTYRQTDI